MSRDNSVFFYLKIAFKKSTLQQIARNEQFQNQSGWLPLHIHMIPPHPLSTAALSSRWVFNFSLVGVGRLLDFKRVSQPSLLHKEINLLFVGTNYQNVTEDMLNHVLNLINNRPRKMSRLAFSGRYLFSQVLYLN